MKPKVKPSVLYSFNIAAVITSSCVAKTTLTAVAFIKEAENVFNSLNLFLSVIKVVTVLEASVVVAASDLITPSFVKEILLPSTDKEKVYCPPTLV